ncbi:MAG: hypothetical protein AAF573_05020 [Bacteroidota bacterium]
MKPEDKYLDDLFAAARSEEPKLSYEEVTETWLTSTATPTFFGTAKEWLLNNISLNSVLIVAVGTASIVLLWLSNTSSNTISEKTPLSIVTTQKLATPAPSNEKTLEVSSVAKVVQTDKIEDQPKAKVGTKKKDKKNPLKNNKTITSRKKVKESPIILSSPKQNQIKTIRKAPTVNITQDLNTESSEPPLSSQKLITPRVNTTFTSPWVVGDGAKNSDWGFVQNNDFTKSTKTSKVIQKCLDLKYLEKVFEKDEDGKFLPLTMASNFYFADHVPVFFKDKKILVVGVSQMGSRPHINVTKYRVKGNRASFKFKYKDYRIGIQLKKISGQWQYHKLKVKSDTDKIDITF